MSGHGYDEGKYLLADDLTRHSGLRGIDQRLPSENVHLNAQLFLHEAACFSASQAIPSYNRRGVYFSLDEFIGTAKEFGSDEDNGSCAVTDLLVLFLGKVYKYPSSGVFNRQQRQDSGAVIRYRNFLHRRRRSAC